ncbi:MAG: LamG-like jellyroll fold domain-containing protein [Solirubrobacteraceae bacterium]
MSPNRPFAVLTALLAGFAVAAPARAADVANADARPDAAAAEVVRAGHRLGPSPDRHIDVARIRRIASRPTRTASARRTASLAATAETPPAVGGKALDLKLLLVSADGTEPTFHWWRDALTKQGVPFDTLIAATAPDLTADALRAGLDHGRYQGVVLATGGLAYSPDGGFTWASALSGAEWATLQDYEREFGVREVDAYAYPQPVYGLEAGAAGSDMSGVQAHVSAGGGDVFSALVGPVPVDQWSWGYQGTPAPGSSWRTLVDGPSGAIAGTYVRSDGTEALVNTVDTNEWSLHGHVLFGGMLEWVTRGVHLGSSRNYLGVDVDDVFLPDDRWSVTSHTTPEDAPNPVRMTPADVTRALDWQHASGVKLNLLFNGDGASAGDPLTAALLAHKSDFRWTSHTFSHPNLDAAGINEIKAEIWKNADFANDHGLPFDPEELTTGEHSGLANPAMAQALIDTGVKWFGADASRQPMQYELGGALSVPRHPTGIYYNVGTREEQLDEYNFVNFTACPAGNLGCLQAPADWDTYVSNEATMILRHVLDNDPRPHYVHQSNLAEDGTMYPVLDEVLRRYHSLFKAELVQPGTRESGEALRRMAAWSAAVASGAASGTVTAGGQVVVHIDSAVAVPVTDASGSGWITPAAGDTTVGSVETPAPAPDPAPQPDPDPAPDPEPTTSPSIPAGSLSELVAADHPIGAWNLDTSGSEIPDAAGGHTGYWRNGPAAFADGIDGAAALFNGGPLYGEINGVPAPQTGYTLEAWVRTSEQADGAIEHGAAGALAILGGKFTFRNVSTGVQAPWTIQPRLWYHVAGVWDGATMRLYVNGNLAASAASAERPSGAATLYLGRGAIAPNLEGRLDAVAYYDHALTGERLAAHAYAGHHPAAAAAATAPATAPTPTAAAPATSTALVATASKPAAAKTTSARAKAKARARHAKARKAKARKAKARRAAARRA